MIIRIVKASKPTYWYAKHIGEVFDVSAQPSSDGGWWVDYRGEHAGYNVAFDDCEIVTETKEAAGLNFNEMGYDDLVAHVEEAVEALRVRTYKAGYDQGKFDAEAEREPMSDAEFERAMKTLDEVSQEARDEIIEKAKRDVAELLRNRNVEFIVNGGKRAVVALLYTRYRYPCNIVERRGIAKCDPSDCFNVHIGKAIALRRALGLEVPAEYYSAPQPTKVRVGDVVAWDYTPDEPYRIDKIDDREYDFTRLNTGEVFEKSFYNNILTAAKVIDDSRE